MAVKLWEVTHDYIDKQGQMQRIVRRATGARNATAMTRSLGDWTDPVRKATVLQTTFRQLEGKLVSVRLWAHWQGGNGGWRGEGAQWQGWGYWDIPGLDGRPLPWHHNDFLLDGRYVIADEVQQTAEAFLAACAAHVDGVRLATPQARNILVEVRREAGPAPEIVEPEDGWYQD